jgi:hypothetical protein
VRLPADLVRELGLKEGEQDDGQERVRYWQICAASGAKLSAPERLSHNDAHER